MKRTALLLTLLMLAAIGGCSEDGDIADTVTVGTWRVSYLITGGDEHTGLFSGYVFTFALNGTVTVTRPDTAPATGTWNEFDNNRGFELEFGKAGLLERLNREWVVDDIRDDELLLHEPGRPYNQLELHRILL